MTRFAAAIVALAGLAAAELPAAEGPARRQMEALGRGVVAVRQDDGQVYVGWRLLGTDPNGIAFHVYRSAAGAAPARLNDGPISAATNFVDGGADLSKDNAWFVRPVLGGTEQAASAPFAMKANAPARPYLAIPLRTPAGCTPNDASVGDLDGDGEYEIVLKQERQPRDNAHSGTTGQTKLEAYRLDGTFLWRIDLGRNIREGAHYTPFLVYDLDGDGRAEVACRTADGTVDGRGKVLGDAQADYRSARGYVLDGPEFITVFDGRTGAALATTDYLPPRGRVRDWGDDYGNRVDRFLACVAYVDGRRPSLVMCRGYYTRAVLVAWNWRDGRLSRVWTFDTDDGVPGRRGYRGQGNHGLSVGDVDGDGRDEVVYGACAIDDNGAGLYTTGLGHGDAMHLSDIDPDRPGLEVFGIHERPRHPYGANLRDAATGKVLWGLASDDVGRGVCMDIDPRHRGYECWAAGGGLGGLYDCKGRKVSDARPRSCNMGVWWDGDVLRELLDGTTISKWDHAAGRERPLLLAAGCARNNGSKSNPCLCADVLGDWREEVIWRTADNRELRVYTTTVPTDRRFYTFMHDPVYRLGVAWQNVAYNQPAHTGFYMGAGMSAPPVPKIAPAGR
ncbi:MAG TPA: rhamnogalacturonan lyase [Phycisphaerae bacterium]|nr:rhamnogalacturonan lyase [Phycisphaerae bacterium]